MKHVLTADKILTERHAKVLLKELGQAKDAAIETKRGLKFVNDYFLVAIAYNTGLRISELVALKWGDIEDEFLVVQRGKGGKRRTVYFGNRTRAIFEEFKGIQRTVFKRDCAGDDRLFIGQRGALTRYAVHIRFKYWVRRCGLPATLSFHSLRHGFGTRLLDCGVPLSSVRDQLGHCNIAVTSVYLHFTEDARERLSRVL
jgi:site-specific recombinase XerD